MGDLINFPANTLFDLRPTLHFKTPQIRYCKPPAGPQHKARHLIKSWNGTCQVCLRGCVTIAVHTTCLFRPRLNYWQNGQTTQNCEQYTLAMKIMTVLGTAHMLSAQLVSIVCQLRGPMVLPANPLAAKTNKLPSFRKPPWGFELLSILDLRSVW